jgi:hypothetical protein
LGREAGYEGDLTKVPRSAMGDRGISTMDVQERSRVMNNGSLVVDPRLCVCDMYEVRDVCGRVGDELE